MTHLSLQFALPLAILILGAAVIADYVDQKNTQVTLLESVAACRPTHEGEIDHEIATGERIPRWEQ